jgi:uncharacterized membrane protein YagU involved in acid resistance
LNTRPLAIELVVGLVAGLLATRVNDVAQRLLYRLTPARERRREPSAAEPTALVAARRTAELLDLPADRRRLLRLKRLIHYGLGAGWGTVYTLVRRSSRLRPAGAGLLSGAGLSLLVDEALCPVLGLSAPARCYPASSHLRGFLTHLVYGLALAASAELLHRAAGASSARRQRWPASSAPTVSARSKPVATPLRQPAGRRRPDWRSTPRSAAAVRPHPARG